MFDVIVGVLIVPLLTGILALLLKSPIVAAWLNLGGSAVTAAGLFWLVKAQVRRLDQQGNGVYWRSQYHHSRIQGLFG